MSSWLEDGEIETEGGEEEIISLGRFGSGGGEDGRKDRAVFFGVDVDGRDRRESLGASLFLEDDEDDEEDDEDDEIRVRELGFLCQMSSSSSSASDASQNEDARAEVVWGTEEGSEVWLASLWSAVWDDCARKAK